MNDYDDKVYSVAGKSRVKCLRNRYSNQISIICSSLEKSHLQSVPFKIKTTDR